MSYKFFVGPIPDGMEVLHKCDNPQCVNPDHLFLGSQKDNMDDMNRKGRGAKGDKNGRRKLNSNEVAEIRSLYAAGKLYQYQIAEKFGVKQSVVSEIVNGKIWRTV